MVTVLNNNPSSSPSKHHCKFLPKQKQIRKKVSRASANIFVLADSSLCLFCSQLLFLGRELSNFYNANNNWSSCVTQVQKRPRWCRTLPNMPFLWGWTPPLIVPWHELRSIDLSFLCHKHYNISESPKLTTNFSKHLCDKFFIFLHVLIVNGRLHSEYWQLK